MKKLENEKQIRKLLSQEGFNAMTTDKLIKYISDKKEKAELDNVDPKTTSFKKVEENAYSLVDKEDPSYMEGEPDEGDLY